MKKIVFLLLLIPSISIAQPFTATELKQRMTDSIYTLGLTPRGVSTTNLSNRLKEMIDFSTIATNITQDATHRFATDAEKTSWNAKEDVANKTQTVTSSSTLFPSTTAVINYVTSSITALNLATSYIKHGGNTLGAAMTQGTLDANSWSVFTNGSGNTRYLISSAGAHTVTATTYALNTTSGGTSWAANGVITHNANTDFCATFGVTGQTMRLIFGTGNGTNYPANWAYMAFTTGAMTSNTTGIYSSGATVIGLRSTNSFVISPTSGNIARIMGGISGTATGSAISITPLTWLDGGGHNPTSGTLDLLQVTNDASNAQYNPSSGTNDFNGVRIVQRVNASGTFAGTIEGVHIAPNILGIANGTFRAIGIYNTVGHGIYQNSASVTNYMQGNVSIGTTTSDSKCILRVSSTTKYVLLPRMTTTERDAITSPDEGAEIYNLTTHKKQVFDGTIWQDCF